jgi:hypothetical protein
MYIFVFMFISRSNLSDLNRVFDRMCESHHFYFLEAMNALIAKTEVHSSAHKFKYYWLKKRMRLGLSSLSIA